MNYSLQHFSVDSTWQSYLAGCGCSTSEISWLVALGRSLGNYKLTWQNFSVDSTWQVVDVQPRNLLGNYTWHSALGNYTWHSALGNYTWQRFSVNSTWQGYLATWLVALGYCTWQHFSVDSTWQSYLAGYGCSTSEVTWQLGMSHLAIVLGSISQ